jgi:hypothetical protein
VSVGGREGAWEGGREGGGLAGRVFEKERTSFTLTVCGHILCVSRVSNRSTESWSRLVWTTIIATRTTTLQ